MFSEKPWKKEFDKLLQEMQTLWGGQIREVEDPDILAPASARLFAYPTYKTEIHNFDVDVTISEFPLPSMGLMGAADNVEFVSVLLVVPCALRAAIRHEHFLDRLKKKLALDYEVQTGNKKFDKDYFLITRPREDISLLKSMQVQQKIRDLEPFDGLAFGIGGINSTHVIDDMSVLEIQNISKIIYRLIPLANLVRKQ